ncbi:hypothetical protein THRCLA_08540 [Thraustotheca clavata]|uniref:Uncharacterized protein n=1 Tax=Thraustotheca clavata TaxID=74557 RepID=A0A1V9Z538_9STRA|nr:hypothetical protein THRCLA_08540 [Thraustotheca clavata]
MNDKQMSDAAKKPRVAPSSRIPLPSVARMERIRPIIKEPVPLQRNMKRKSQEIEKAPVFRAKRDEDVEMNDTFAERLKQSNELMAQGQLLRAQVENEQLTAKLAQSEKREKSAIARSKRYADTIKSMQQQIEELTRAKEDAIKLQNDLMQQKNDAIQQKNEAIVQKNVALQQKNEIALQYKEILALQSAKESMTEKKDGTTQTDPILETITFEKDMLLYQQHEEIIDESLLTNQRTKSMLEKMLNMAKKRGVKSVKEDNQVKEEVQEKEQVNEPALPLLLRMGMIAITSVLAEKGWRNREVLTSYLYNDNQTPTEQAMISVFAYILLMGALFLSGFIMSMVTNLIKNLLYRKK